MTPAAAFQLARKPDLTDEEWAQIKATLLPAGWCPACATSAEPARHRLGRPEPATRETYAGRACLVCEEFYPDPHQSHHETEPDYGGVLACDGAVYSDADPGL